MVDFSYNRVIHSPIGLTPFEIFYGFNPLTFLNFTLLYQNVEISLDGEKLVKSMKKLHEKVRLQLVKKNPETTMKENKERKRVVFESGNRVWIHFRSERFPNKRKEKLTPKGEVPCHVLE